MNGEQALRIHERFRFLKNNAGKNIPTLLLFEEEEQQDEKSPKED